MDHWLERLLMCNRDAQRKKLRWRGSWRSTYLCLSEESPRVPCRDVYSDAIYRPFLCAQTPLKSYTEKIPRANAISKLENMSFIDFSSSWTDTPFILTTPIRSWPAFKDWSVISLLEKYSRTKFRAEAVDWPLEVYVEYLNNNQDESPLYLFDRGFVEKMGLRVGAKEGDGDYWPPSCFGSDLFTALGQERPDNQWLIIGPERSGSTFHKDPNATSAWNAVLRGSKYWLMFPPSATPPGVFVSSDGGEVTSPLSIAEYLLGFHGIARSIPGCREGICGEGEVMHVPSGWWHLVVNLDSAIAITQNFVAKQGVGKVLKFLSEKKDQVSGFRDDVEDPYGLFVKGLAKDWPEIFDETGRGSKRKWSEVAKELQSNEDHHRRTGFTFGFAGEDSDEDVL